MTTYMANATTVQPRWLQVDAKGKTLGRLASAIAMILQGKRNPEYTPHTDTGDFVVVINVDQLIVTGKKKQDKKYHHHSGYPGGIKTTNFANLHARNPSRVLKLAVKGMMGKGPLAYQMLRKLKVYAGNKHPHVAQKPEPIDLEEV